MFLQKMNIHEVLMKTLEENKILRKNQCRILTKLLISLLIISLEFQTSYQSSVTTLYSYLMGRYEKKSFEIII